MTASQGKDCIFSAVPVAIFQGVITIIAVFVGGFMTDLALSYLSYVGNVLIFCVGLNLIRKKQIRVANLLPLACDCCCMGICRTAYIKEVHNEKP